MGLRRLFVLVVVAALAMIGTSQEAADLSSTRSTVSTFLMATRDQRWDVALETLDLSDFPVAQRREVGIAAAKVILRAIEGSLVEVTDIPEERTGPPVVIARLKPNPTERAIEITLERSEQGDWRFSKETIRAVPVLRSLFNSSSGGSTTTPAAPGKSSSSSAVSKSVSDMLGQISGMKPPSSPSSGTATASPDVGLTSPQATMSTYLIAMNDGDIATALSTLDLSQISPVVRTDEGTRSANLLFAILNRTEYINVDELPADPPGVNYTYWTYRNRATGDVVGEIILARGSDDQWRFSASSIAQLPAIWELMKDRPVIPGLKDVSEIDFEPSTWLKSRLPETWLKPFAGLARWQWIGMGVLLGVTAIFSFLVRAIVAAILSRRAKDRPEGGGRQSAISIGRAASWLFAFIVIHVGLPFLGLPRFIHTPLVFIATVGLYFAIGWLLFGVLDRIISFAANRAAAITDKGQKLIAPVAAKLGRAVIVIGVLISMMSTFGVNVTALVAGLGIGGLVLALAAKDSVENLFGSFTILMEMPFGIGDWVKIGDVEGVVEQINLRSTRIRTFSDSIIVLPNKNLITAAMENMGARRRRQFKTSISLGSHTSAASIRKFCDRVRDELIENPGIDNDTAFCSFFNFGDNLLSVLLSCYISAPTYAEELRIRQDILTRILEIADELEVEVATPSRAIQIEPLKPPTEKNAPNPQT